ncbi:MAG: hypothetical protein CVU55_08450 [Deltaproteobacteria bacterium HGW-Deltaproteobacteria-13]|jgi:phenylacetate-CoA ligase|nr:MAG: hypothetical protein CVU55_08450 [Deltaproteobacteria bacterium HGW-Deltaproteobacteria-13]
MIGKWTRFLPRKRKADVDRAVRYIVSSAYKNVPFYRRIYDLASVDPASIRGAEDLPRLPIVSRLDLMVGGPAAYLHRNISPGKLTIKHTTGTTGTPVIVHMNKREEAFRKITILDAFQRNGRLTCPLTIIDVGGEVKDSATQIEQRIGPVRIIRLFRTMPMEQQIDVLTHSRPALINGRPSALWQLANALLEKRIDPPTPSVINTGAEMLFDNVRELLQNVFGCRVADNYNCEEVGNTAWQCPSHTGRMHPNMATVWIETVDQQGNPVPAGSEGRLLVTNIYNSSMPFIRYETGDRGTLMQSGHCQCGFNGPVMRLMEGRNENFIVLPDGREITPRLMYEVINSAFPHDDPRWNMIDAIRMFQIIQEAKDLIVVKVVPGPAYSESLWRAVEENLKRLHPAMFLKVEIVNDLRPEPGKKFHQVLGKLNSRWRRERENQSDK